MLIDPVGCVDLVARTELRVVSIRRGFNADPMRIQRRSNAIPTSTSCDSNLLQTRFSCESYVNITPDQIANSPYWNERFACYDARMPIALSDISAARFWMAYEPSRSTRCEAVSANDAARVLGTGATVAERDALRSLGMDRFGAPLHVLVSDSVHRRRHSELAFHVHSGELPPRSLYRVADSLFVVSPGLALVQLARRATVSQAAFAAMSLCGIYRLSFGDSAGHDGSDALDGDGALTRRRGITTIETMRRYADHALSVRGALRARKALEYAADRARSPMEISVFLGMCLPYRFGGYGMPKPLLNYAALQGSEGIESDLVWPDRRVAVEYLGEAFHTELRSLSRDVRRSNAYAGEGFCAFAITKEQYSNRDQFAKIADDLGRALGRRVRPPKWFAWRQAEMRRDIANMSRLLSSRDCDVLDCAKRS